MNDAEPYIAAVADACQTAGLHVVDYASDDIDPRDGIIELTLDPDADLDGDDWRKGRTLGWNEERGWLIGRPKDPHGELAGILYLCGNALPAPADVAEQARKVISGEISSDEKHHMMRPVRYRSLDDEDDFENELAAYATAATAGEE